ncbi:MAG: glutathione S-transferase family protein, partial [Pseudomonadota bacterium]
MILYGRDLSPFTRRVAIWMDLQGREVERRKITVAGEDFEHLKTVNPLGRVPALVLDDGSVLVESGAIVDWLEDTAPEGKRLIPATGEARRECLQHMAYGQSTAEKTVAFVYDKVRRPEEFHYQPWIARLEGQISAGLGELERRVPGGGWFGGAAPNGADIAVVIAW